MGVCLLRCFYHLHTPRFPYPLERSRQKVSWVAENSCFSPCSLYTPEGEILAGILFKSFSVVGWQAWEGIWMQLLSSFSQWWRKLLLISNSLNAVPAPEESRFTDEQSFKLCTISMWENEECLESIWQDALTLCGIPWDWDMWNAGWVWMQKAKIWQMQQKIWSQPVSLS